jgi:hypothetical protein
MTTPTRWTWSGTQNHTLLTKPSVWQNNVPTGVLLVLWTNTTYSHNSYTQLTSKMTRNCQASRGGLTRVRGWLNCLLLGRQETLQDTSSEHQNSPRSHPLDPLVKDKLATRESWQKLKLHPKGLGAIRPATRGGLTSCTEQWTQGKNS